MHKFFCSYNNFTERYELTKSQGIFSPRVNIQAENILLNQIKKNIQSLYELTVTLKENEKDEQKLITLDQTELLISNLYYSLFASPLDINENKRALTGTELAEAIKLVGLLERDINIPEYNRMALIIKNNLTSLSLSS
ncbi:MAG: hypothetical protein IJY90_02205 [Clostridia bacterium]|nr:hypothetical protein [Clostridia bacterium]